MNFRLLLILVGVGGFLSFMGYKNYSVARESDAEPTRMAVADIEGGAELENLHVELGPHWGVLGESVYYGPENQANKIDYLYYPAISEGHPFNVAIDRLSLEFPDGNIPPERMPPFKKFDVLIKTERYGNINDIKSFWHQSDGLRGLVINQLNALGNDEKSLLNQSFPAMNFDEVLVIEEGREPMGTMPAISMMGGGGLLILIGLGSAAFSAGKGKAS